MNPGVEWLIPVEWSSQIPPSVCGRDTGCTNGTKIWLSPRILTQEFEDEDAHFERPEGISHAAALILHEFGHLVFGHPYNDGMTRELKEQQADCWAAGFVSLEEMATKQNIGGAISMCRKLVFVAPHRCVQPDPACDIRSGVMAMWFGDRIASTLSSEVETIVLLSKVTRSACDPNRATCTHARVREQLRRVMDKSRGACIIEVHSFPASIAVTLWRLLSIPKSVVLNIRRSRFEADVSRSLGSTVLDGHPTANDIGREATLKGWNHVLLELRDDLSREEVETLADGFVQAMQREKRK